MRGIRLASVGLAVVLLTACGAAGLDSEVTTAGMDGEGYTLDSVSEDLAAPLPDLSPEELYPGEPGAAGIFLATREHFFDQPFPSNTRVRADGRIDLSDFPNPNGIGLLDDYIKVANNRLFGFSPNGGIYFRFDAPLDPAQLPAVNDTLDAGAPFFLVNVTPDSAHRGEIIPLEAWYWDREAPSPDYYLQADTLVVRPLGGFPMRPGELYACVVTRRLKDAAGRHLAPTGLVAQALQDNTGALSGVLSPLRSWLAQTPGIAAHDVAVATVFVTADPVREMDALARFVRDEGVVESAGPVEPKPTVKDYELFYGHYLAPNFMAGDPPYKTGGEILFDGDGQPVVQWQEEITFALTVPFGPTPPGGWPLVMYSHGTGGKFNGFTKTVAEDFAERGIAMIGIDQPLHGERYDGPAIDLEFYSFNFTNPMGARSLFRQGAVDFVSLTKLVADLSFTSNGRKISFDLAKLGYFGHSQGGLTGALFLAVGESLRASVLSGAGGGLTYTIMERKQLDSGTAFDIKAALETLLSLAWEDELTLFHPVMTLAQTLVDITDPINYAPHYYEPRFVADPVNVLITEGVQDPYTPAVTTENLAIAGSISPLAPLVHSHPGFALRGLPPLTLPVTANRVLADGTSATAGLAQWDGYGHFVAFENLDCVHLYLNFFESAFTNAHPTLSK